MSEVQTGEPEMEQNRSKFIYNKVYEVLSHAAATELGQYTIRHVDNLLWKIEKTAKWSIPENLDIDDSKTINVPPLVRPLPWLLFIPALIALRFIRIALTFISLCLGGDPVTSKTIVYFIQTRRRKLRSIKYDAFREMRRKLEENGGDPAKSKKLSIFSFMIGLLTALLNVKQMSSQSPSRTGSRRQGRTALQTSGKANQPTKKRHLNEDSEDEEHNIEDLTADEALEKYADYSGDSLYEPNENDITSSEDSYESDDCGEDVLNKTMSEKKADTPLRQTKSNSFCVYSEVGNKLKKGMQDSHPTSTPKQHFKSKTADGTPTTAEKVFNTHSMHTIKTENELTESAAAAVEDSQAKQDELSVQSNGKSVERTPSTAIVQNGSLPIVSNNKDYSSITSNNKCTTNSENVEMAEEIKQENGDHKEALSNQNDDASMQHQQRIQPRTAEAIGTQEKSASPNQSTPNTNVNGNGQPAEDESTPPISTFEKKSEHRRRHTPMHAYNNNFHKKNNRNFAKPPPQ